jgi:hypothetical protein
VGRSEDGFEDWRATNSLGFHVSIHLKTSLSHLNGHRKVSLTQVEWYYYVVPSAHAHNHLVMSPWKPLATRNDGSVCRLQNASIWWTNELDAYNAIGTVEIHVDEVPGLFRIVIEGTRVLWNKEDGRKSRGSPIKHCLYLPTDGNVWSLTAGGKKSHRRPTYKAYVVAMQFSHPTMMESLFSRCVLN